MSQPLSIDTVFVIDTVTNMTSVTVSVAVAVTDSVSHCQLTLSLSAGRSRRSVGSAEALVGQQMLT